MICSTPAFVLKSYDFRETSKIAVFFTRDFGKVKGILKGIRKDPKKFSSTLPLLSLNHIVFYRKRVSEIHLVGQCDLIDDFGLTRGDLKQFSSSSFVAELVDCILPLEDPNKEIFDLVFNFLNSLKGNLRELNSIFEVKILAASGFKPHFDSCVSCDSRIAQAAYFSNKRGGLLCKRCLAQDPLSEPVLPGTIATILYIERFGWHNCLRLNMLVPVQRQLDKILRAFLNFHVGKTLRTDGIVHEVLDL